MNGKPQILLVTLLLATLGSGCTRRFFREYADRDVEKVLTEKNVFEPWRIEQWHVYPDPRARFADPTNPDRPPMPPDDPAAQYLSPNPQRPGRAGVTYIEGTGYLDLLAAWDSMNRANQTPKLTPVDNPARSQPSLPPPDAPPGTAEHPYLINLEQCCELGLINSRDFQDQRENLYLTALPVTLQRFSFAAQLFALGNANFQSGGSATATPGQRWTGSASDGVRKLFPAGASLLAQLANRFVFDLTNGTPTVSISNLTLNLAQPLLQGGGRAVTLEPLTQAERNLLYQIRTYARFRKQFFVQIAAGGGGGGAGAALLDPSLGALATAFGPTTGYLPTVRLVANLEIDRENVRRLAQYVRLFEALAEGGELSQLQVDTLRQSLLQGQATVLQDELQLRNSLDSFKIQLGMPPSTHIELDLAPIEPLQQQFRRIQDPIDDYQELAEELRDANPNPNVPKKYRLPDEAPKLRQKFKELAQKTDLVQGTTFRERFPELWGLWEKLSDQEIDARLADLRRQRRLLLDERTKVEGDEAKTADVNRRLMMVESESRVGAFEKALREYEKQPWKQAADAQVASARQNALYNIVADSFELLFIEARNERLEMVRRQWPSLPPICIEGVDLINAPLEEAYAKASQQALLNRLDLMNARAELVDRWRQIAVRANSLFGVLDIGYSLESATPALPAQPLNFSSARTTQRLTINGELPLVRRFERNNYRVALINYQRERRALQLQEDSIVNSIRQDLRQLRVLAETYKIQQQQVALAYNNVEQALEAFRQPATPSGAPGPPGAGSGQAGTAAALTQQIQSAQASLNRAQIQMYQIWINYLTLRMRLFLNMELMPLDPRGVWIDDYASQCLAEPGGQSNTKVVPNEQLPASRPAQMPLAIQEPTSR